MHYSINFDSGLSPQAVRDEFFKRLGEQHSRFFVGTHAELNSMLQDETVPYPLASVFANERSQDQFGCHFEAWDELGDAIGNLSTLHLATMLCTSLNTRALIEDGGGADDCWMLVTADGWHGRVVVDDDALDDGDFQVLHAYQPVPSAPEIPVQEPPEWQTGWYEGGQVPEAGYLDIATES